MDLDERERSFLTHGLARHDLDGLDGYCCLVDASAHNQQHADRQQTHRPDPPGPRHLSGLLRHLLVSLVRTLWFRRAEQTLKLCLVFGGTLITLTSRLSRLGVLATGNDPSTSPSWGPST